MATKTPSRSRRKSPARRPRQAARKTKPVRRAKKAAATPVSPAIRRKLEKLGARWQIILPRLRAAERTKSRSRSRK